GISSWSSSTEVWIGACRAKGSSAGWGGGRLAYSDTGSGVRGMAGSGPRGIIGSGPRGMAGAGMLGRGGGSEERSPARSAGRGGGRRHAHVDALGRNALVLLDAHLIRAQLLRQLRDPRLRCRRRPLQANMVDAGRNHRNADDAFEAFVEGGADDDIGVLVDLL